MKWEDIAERLSDEHFYVSVLDDGDGPAVIKLNVRENGQCIAYWETNYIKPDSEEGNNIISSVKAAKRGLAKTDVVITEEVV